jgi:heterodisulfide reductase subunit A-like polyferredoxin
MARIGIFIDAMQGSVPAAFREKVLSAVRGFPEVRFIVEEEDLTSPPALGRMAERLKAGEAERFLILGGSPKKYETSFRKFGHASSLNPYLFTVANLREEALLAQANEEDAVEKAGKIATKAIRMASLAGPIEAQSLPLKPEALVIGGGIAGISTALALAQSGIYVFLVEKGKTLGGKASELKTFYNRPDRVQEWMEAKIAEVSGNPRIELLLETELKRLDGHLGRFQARVRRSDGAETILSPSAIVVAAGYGVQGNRKEMDTDKDFISLAEMERHLDENRNGPLLRNGKRVEMVVFLLDQVNEDMKVDSVNAVKLGLQVQEDFQCQAVILCRDVKVSSDGMERLYRKARERGVLFFKYNDPPKLSTVKGRIQVDVRDTAAIHKEGEWPVSILPDLVVLSEAFTPNPEAEDLCRILGIHTGNRGFLMEDNPQLLRVRSNRRGIFVAGGCRFPQEVSETLVEAKAAAQEVIALLSNGTYAYDLSVAEVDPGKCAVCYTCPRLCPHSAITVEKYADRNIYAASGVEVKWGAARVDPVACYGCGICVGECPAKAITLHHLTDTQIYAQMGLIESECQMTKFK